MSDWKEITDIEKITVQPLLKLSSDQYGITLIIHLIFTILNSFQPFFFCAGVSILSSCSVSAPTPLSLRVCPEQKAQLLGADSFELPSTSNPASVSPHYKWKNQLEARKLWVSAQRLWQDSSRYYAVTEESWALEEPNMLIGWWTAENNVCQCSCPGVCSFSLSSLSSKSKSSHFLPFLTVNIDFLWVSRTIKASPTKDSRHSFALLGWQEINSEIQRDKCRRTHEDNEAGQQLQPDSGIQQPLKYWLVTVTLLSAVLIKTKFLLQLFFFFFFQCCFTWIILRLPGTCDDKQQIPEMTWSHHLHS